MNSQTLNSVMNKPRDDSNTVKSKDNDKNLPTSMPKSPRMVPGFDFNGSVAPSI